ncbi:MAG: hypothetical protein JW900_05405 [Anaerolineae bacterium]|nr:hypothetical protein [Anaerolineae bacterium]
MGKNALRRHVVRYLSAGCLSTLVMSMLPLVVILALMVVAGLVILFLFFGAAAQNDLPMAVMINGVLAALTLLAGISSALVSVLLSSIFLAAAALPFSLVVEIVGWRSVLARVIGFLVAGVIVGLMTALVGIGATLLLEIALSPSAMVGLALLLFGTGFGALCLFGFTLTAIAVAQERG